jgi:glucose/arabinose dehydrogenase
MKRISVLIAGLLFNAAVYCQDPLPFETTLVASMDAAWAIEFMPDGRMLVTEKAGRLYVVTQDGKKSDLITSGIPAVDVSGQGGLGDIALHPDFKNNNIIYLSFTEAGDNDTRGGAVGRGRLQLTGNGGSIEDFKVIWRQDPKLDGAGHFSQRLHFSPDGHLFITSGERQAFDPAQDMKVNLGKVIRLNADGSVPDDNPFADQGGLTAQIWSSGHRNLTGIDFDAEGNLWESEMGASGGDELNKIEKGANYGWPVVSNGNHYDGKNIPEHDSRPEFTKPVVWWHPAISPGSVLVYQGDLFPEWKGNIFVAGLSSRSIIRVGQRFGALSELERFNLGARIRDIEQGPDGSIWLVMDPDNPRKRWTGGILKLTPAK